MLSKSSISAMGVLVLLSVSSPAHAYLDPATGSIMLQAAIGAVAGGMLFFRTQLYRVKSFFSRGRNKSDGK